MRNVVMGSEEASDGERAMGADRHGNDRGIAENIGVTWM